MLPLDVGSCVRFNQTILKCMAFVQCTEFLTCLCGEHFIDVWAVDMQLFRPPHGTPFIHNTADVYRAASVVRRHAVMVLWTFGGNPNLDWDCDTDVQCVLNSYLSFFQSSLSGIPLMHAVKAGTAGAAFRLTPSHPACFRN